MKDNVKRVFYVRYLAHPCYLEIIAQRPEIRLDKLEHETADAIAAPIIAAAHAYQIGAAIASAVSCSSLSRRISGRWAMISR